MFLSIKKNLTADIILLRQKSAVVGAFWLSSLILLYILFSSSTMLAVDKTGYYLRQACTTLTIINLFAVIIVGAFLGSVDNENRTYCIRLVNTTRVRLGVSRIILLIGTTLVFFVFHALLGELMDVAAHSVERNIRSLLLLVFVCWLVSFFWSSFAYLFAFVSGSFSVTTTFAVGVYFIESFLDRFMPRMLLEFLPVWNQKNLLIECFPKQEGVVAVVQQQEGSFGRSLTMIIFYTALIQACILIFGKRKQY